MSYPPTVNPERPWEATICECAVFGHDAAGLPEDAPIMHSREMSVAAATDDEGRGKRLLSIDIGDQRFLVREDALLTVIEHAPEIDDERLTHDG